MASIDRVSKTLRMVGSATGHRYFSTSEEAAAIDAYHFGLESFSDAAVEQAGREWAVTMTHFPKLAELVTLCRTKDLAIGSARRAPQEEGSSVCPACDHGWQSEFSIEYEQQVERFRKCRVCGGPQPQVKPSEKSAK